MSKEEFELSKHRYPSYDGVDENGIAIDLSWHYPEEEIKEFIRLLKEEAKRWMLDNELELFKATIDKLAGEKLIK